MSKNTENSFVVAMAIAAVSLFIQIMFGETFYNDHIGWGLTIGTIVVFAVGIVKDVRNGVNPFHSNNSGD